MAKNFRPCWQNCYGPDDKSFLHDKELLAIDAMEDSIAPLGRHTTRIRQLVTRFEACYHEADKEAERTAKAIGTGRCPRQSTARPPQRKRELQNTRRILARWCKNPAAKGVDLDVGGVSAEKLLSFIGQPSPLRIWQVERIVDKVTYALDSSRPYHNMALDLGDYGEPGANPVGRHYQDAPTFLKQTRQTIIRDTVDGRKAKISLAMAIDLLMPCHWDFVGGLSIILKAIGGELHPDKPYACCARNLKLSPLCDRLKMISRTLRVFWKGGKMTKNIDSDTIASLGSATPVKRWLAASLDKTIRLQLEASCGFWLEFS